MSDIPLLSWAAGNGDAEMTRLLLEHGADVGLRDEFGRTPLAHAAVGHASTVRLVLGAGADVEALDKNEKSPFFSAMTDDFPTPTCIPFRGSKRWGSVKYSPEYRREVVRDRAEICRLLLEFGTSCLDSYGVPGYRYALENGHGEILQVHSE
ncbi:ankyrin repeat domain-containing protein [Aspergillus undulatus]|uniref:ankyrin repeat domain-containing protein n=1 Tax=Aspergillus undulatus TaxID=1810928 RepID=UPI003CCD68C8